MIWWIKTRRAHSVLPAALAGYLLYVLVSRNTFVPLPSIVGASNVVLSSFAPIPVVVGLAMSLSSRLPAAEASGTRQIPRMDAVLATTVVAAAVAIGLLLMNVTDATQAAAAGRNTAFLVGLFLCAKAVVGQRAVLIPVAWLMAVVLLGFRASGDPYPWTIVPEPAGAPHAAIGAAVLFLAGIMTLLRTSRKLS
ncbi:hypothetical protein FCH28_24500 [Streptomyces piniterrae]|uniref:ABC transporter n=1 Tax=Streptomyces piniterrae TaxID=2571125 RepID=A0A4U0N7U8_9ACTN|nr:hypothetical protein [Streptomyces piniterrae]TJZ49472.1 hypothetical protein FCH28_24500 [Streptomyces piniterrae]